MAANNWTMLDRLDMRRYLGPADVCFYYLIYTPRAGYSYSEANDIVINYKIPIGTENGLRAKPAREHFKNQAIAYYANAIEGFLRAKHLKSSGKPLSTLGSAVGLVPMPPSMCPSDSDYDDRNIRTCELIANRIGCKVCRDIETVRTSFPSHSGGPRSPEELQPTLGRVGHEADDCALVFLVDDVLSSGAHYAAAKSLLARTGCQAQVIGLFLALAAGQSMPTM